MKKLDRYIIRKFLSTFVFMLSFIMVLAIVFDVAEKLDDLLVRNATFKAIVFDYYVNFIIHYSNLFSALIIFLSVIWFSSRMAQNSETIAILSGGVSFNRFLRPYFIAATLLVGLTYVSNHYILPEANKKRLAFENEFIKGHYFVSKTDYHAEIEPGSFVYFNQYHSIHHVANRGFILEKWDEDRLVEEIQVERAKFDSLQKKWTLLNYVSRKFLDSTHVVTYGKEKDTIIPFGFEDFGKRLNHISALTTPELDAFIAKEKRRGSENIPFYLVEKYQRTSLPFSTYILVFLGALIASRKQRGGIGLHLFLGILIAVGYIFFLKVATVAATNAGVDPLMAVWFPNLIFVLVALVFYRFAQK